MKSHITLEKIKVMNVDPTELCSCKCHFGGAESCPKCKNKHGVVCNHCKD